MISGILGSVLGSPHFGESAISLNLAVFEGFWRERAPGNL